MPRMIRKAELWSKFEFHCIFYKDLSIPHLNLGIGKYFLKAWIFIECQIAVDLIRNLSVIMHELT